MFDRISSERWYDESARRNVLTVILIVRERIDRWLRALEYIATTEMSKETDS